MKSVNEEFIIAYCNIEKQGLRCDYDDRSIKRRTYNE